MRNKRNIIATICLMIAVVLFIISFAFADFDFKNLSTEQPYEDKEYQVAEEIQSINVQTDFSDVAFVPSEDDTFHIKYSENNTNTYEISVVNKELKVIKKTNKKWYDYIFNIKIDRQSVVVAVPSAFAGDVYIETKHNDVEVQDLSLNNLEIENSNDSITVDNVKLKGELKLDNSHGDTIVRDTDIEQFVTCISSHGDIEFINVTAMDIVAENRHGDIELTNVISEQSIELTNSHDSIELKKVGFGDKMICDNSNGEIIGSIIGNIGDFTIDTYISHGQCNLPKQLISGDKLLKLSTNNDDISIVFVE